MTQAAQQATTIGAMAQEALALERHAWRVLASVSGAIYIQREPNRLLWITDRESALHSRAIVVREMSSPLPSAGSACYLGQGELGFNDSWGVDCQYAFCWFPDWCDFTSQGVILDLDRVEAVLAAVARLSRPQGGMAGVLPFLDVADVGDGIERGIFRAACVAIRTCQQPAEDINLLDIVKGCRGLIGLGSGLTPSGDDFLAAYLFTHRASEIVSGYRSNTDWEGIRTWLQNESCRTNAISSTLLLDCAEGVAAAPLHDFVHAVLSEVSLDELMTRARRLAGIGHSSGWDMLTGVHAAIVSLTHLKRDAVASDGANRHAVCRKEVLRVW